MLARVLTAALVVAAAATTLAAQVVRLPSGPADRPPVDPVDVKTRLARALELADIDDVRVLIKWVAAGSDSTRKFNLAAVTPDVRRTRFESHEYHVVTVDVGKLDQHLDLARQYGVTIKDELLPSLTVLDQQGKVIAHATAPDFLSRERAGEFDPAKVAAFFTLHQAPVPDAAAPFDAAVKRAKSEGKLVFVWFSAPW